MTAVAMTHRDRGRRPRASKMRPPRPRSHRSAVHADHRSCTPTPTWTACSTRSRGRGRWRSSPSWPSSAASPSLEFRRTSKTGTRRQADRSGRLARRGRQAPAGGRPRRRCSSTRSLLLLILGSGGSLKWVDSYGIQILIYVMLGWGLNIVVGLAGLLDLGYVAFYAVGAYSYALLATTFGLSFWICLPLAGILAALWGIMLGFPGAAPARRLSGHRHARLRRNHPHHSRQLGRLLRRRRRHRLDPEDHLLRPALRRPPTTASTSSSTWITRRSTARCSSIT